MYIFNTQYAISNKINRCHYSCCPIQELSPYFYNKMYSTSLAILYFHVHEQVALICMSEITCKCWTTHKLGTMYVQTRLQLPSRVSKPTVSYRNVLHLRQPEHSSSSNREWTAATEETRENLSLITYTLSLDIRGSVSISTIIPLDQLQLNMQVSYLKTQEDKEILMDSIYLTTSNTTILFTPY